MIIYICISKFVNKTRTGKLPSFTIAGQPAGFVNNDGWRPEGPEGLRVGLTFYSNIFLIIMVKFQEKVC